jgi:hypothetical protein
MGGSSLEALERALGIEAVLEEGQAFRPKRRVGYVLRRDHADTGACMGAAGGDSGARGGDRHAEHAAARAKSENREGHASARLREVEIEIIPLA